MPEYGISGESMKEIAEEAERFRRLEELDDEDLIEVYEDIKKTRDALRKLTNNKKSVRKQDIKDQAGLRGHRYPLELLKALEYHDLAENSGQGGGWRYIGGVHLDQS